MSTAYAQVDAMLSGCQLVSQTFMQCADRLEYRDVKLQSKTENLSSEVLLTQSDKFCPRDYVLSLSFSHLHRIHLSRTSSR